jgi:hypothetical protein
MTIDTFSQVPCRFRKSFSFFFFDPKTFIPIKIEGTHFFGLYPKFLAKWPAYTSVCFQIVWQTN